MAEGILHHLLQQRGQQDKWLIDSAAIADYHLGSPPDPRTMEVLEKNGITGYRHLAHRCRQITQKDFTKFDFIFGMDHQNIEDLNDIKPTTSTATITLLGSYDPHKVLIIDDPFCTFGYNRNAFNEVYDQCLRCCQAFMDYMESS